MSSLYSFRLRSFRFEQYQRNRVPLRDVTCVVDMQMISAVEAWQYLRRVIWIAYGGVEIDHAVEFAAVADPRVNLLPYLFVFGAVKVIEEKALEYCLGSSARELPASSL